MVKKYEWRLIVSQKKTPAELMAIDEVLFDEKHRTQRAPSILHIYTWDAPCVTFGYFQKYALFEEFHVPKVRRLTGGLGVLHGSDIAYSCVLDAQDYPFVYDQKAVYQKVHGVMKTALEMLGITTTYASLTPTTKTRECRDTLFEHDLMSKGSKIVGSCQRRRSGIILQQGSLSIGEMISLDSFIHAVCPAWETTFSCSIKKDILFTESRGRVEDLIKAKYSQRDWNEDR